VDSTGIRRSRPLPAVVATVVAGIVAGCATVPSTNAPRQVLTGGNDVQAYVRPLPPPPPSSRLYKSAYDTVLGFLSASATYAYDPAAARQFLSPAQRKTWRPGPVTVVNSLSQKPPPSGGTQNFTCRTQAATCTQFRDGKSSAGVQYDQVNITALHLATLSSGGQYEPSAGTANYSFSLARKDKGVWLITKLPPGVLHSLLLTKTSFQEVYQPRNLFFFARQGTVVNGELVPDPVYAPLQSANNALNTDVAAGLVKGLLRDPSGWLSDATTTAFPPGTTLKKVTLRGQVAIVDLGGTAKRATTLRRTQMKEQLLATLASKAYSSPLAHNVVLEIDGQQPYESPIPNLVSRVSLGQLVYQSGPDTVSEIGKGNVLSHLAVPRQIGLAQITALAAPEGGTDAAVAVQSGGGCAVYVPAPGQSGGPYRSLQIPESAGPCTSLSWDVNGNLWAVAGGHIWLLEPRANSQWLAVTSPGNLPSDGKSGPSVLSMQMAPDGVRAALLVKASGGNRVLLAAVVFKAPGRKVVNDNGRPKVDSVKGSVSLGAAVLAWPGLSRPTALSWYNPYELVVLTRTGVWQVPLTGGAGRMLGSAPAGAMSLATNGAALAVGTSDHGRYGLELSTNAGNSWSSITFDTYPTYPTYTTFQS
jgi:Lipoprotein LpqB beta-propeller domain/Sporulation and spore germination